MALVLSLYRGHIDHTPHTTFAMVRAYQHGQQLAHVQPITLGATLATIDLNGGGIHHRVGDPVRLHKAMQPETFPARFIATHHGGGFREPKASSLNLLQSRGGSLHLPLFQNGACPFPGTPLLSVLMLVAHTVREIVPILPRLRIVAVAMQGLQVRRAAIAAIAIDMIDFNPIVVVKEQPTVGTAPTLRFEQRRQSRTDPWVPSLSRAPIDPVPIIGTAVASDFDMPGDGDLTMER